MPEMWEERVTMFCAYLIKFKGFQSSTIRSYISAIKSKLLADNYNWSDDNIKLATLTSFCSKRNDKYKTRLPISHKLLQHILFETDRMMTSPFMILLYQMAFSLAYYGLLRIGELTISKHVIKAKDIHKANNKNKVLIVLYSSKTHGRRNKPQMIKIAADEEYDVKMGNHNLMRRFQYICPFFIIQQFLQICGGYDTDDEPLLIFSDETPFERNTTEKNVAKNLKRLNLNGKLYDVHSFRKGRAVDMLREGYSVEQIKKAGRWKSNAVYKYLE